MEKRRALQARVRTGDLFEDLAAALGCAYISDLHTPKYQCAARLCLAGPGFAGYPAAAWRDMLGYLSVEGAQEADSEEQAKRLLGAEA